MSITEELRKWAKDNTLQNMVLTTYPPQHTVHGVLETLLRIADRIDAEHERKVADTRNDALYHANESDMAELGWIRLPKDRDGEYIHIGDVMENLREDLEPQLHHTFRVYGIQYRDYEQMCTLTEDGYPTILYRANECRHYHAPTVEDVLEEFAMRTEEIPNDASGIEPFKALVADFAKRLKLAGDAE